MTVDEEDETMDRFQVSEENDETPRPNKRPMNELDDEISSLRAF